MDILKSRLNTLNNFISHYEFVLKHIPMDTKQERMYLDKLIECQNEKLEILKQVKTDFIPNNDSLTNWQNDVNNRNY